MEARHYVATVPRSRPDYRLKRAFCEQSSLARFAFTAPARTHFFCKRANKQKSKASNGAHARLSNGSVGGGGSSLSGKNEEEGSVLQDIASLFCSCEKLKAMVDSSLNSGVGLDMRNRVDHLFKRVDMLNQSAERAARIAGGRVPAQLIASFKGLQREHSSLENIVRLATEAGPVLVELESNNQDEYSVAMAAAQKGTLSVRYGAESVDVEPAEGQKNETAVEVLSGPKYVMSTPPSENSSKLAAVRAEIERRVMQQLVKKQFNQPIFGSGQDYTKGHESKLTNFQKVPGVNGQRDTEGKSEVDTAVLAGKGLLPQMVEAKELDQATVLDTSYSMERSEFEARQFELENVRTVSLEIHQQMVSRFEKALLDLREQLSQVTEDLKQKEAMLVAVKEKLMSEQSKLSEKINELSTEIMRRLTAEELNHALRKALNELDNNLKDTQNQVVSLGFELAKKERVLVVFQEEQERTKQELRADILSLKDKLCHISKMYEGFKPQSVIVDLGSVKATLSALQNNQTLEQDKMVDCQEKLETLEKALCSNVNQIKELTTEVDRRVTKREVNDVLSNVMDEMEKRSKQLQDCIKLIGSEQEKNEAVVGLLQEDWKTHRNELQTLTTQNDLNVQGVLTELSNKLTDVQEEQKHEQALIREVQQQMAALEGKGLELVKRISEEAEAQKQVLLDEVRTLVEELLEASHLSPGNSLEDALLIQESDATKLDVRHLRNLINDSGRQTSSSELNANISSHDQYEETLHGGAQEMPDKRTASLGAFFSVMGQLIRQELKRMDATSAESLPLAELTNSGGQTHYAVSGNVEGSGGTYKNREDQGQNFITLRYESSWNRAFVHYCADNHGWTEVPGMAMEEASNIKGKYWKEFKIKAARLEFVVTDGEGNWDRAPNGCNYVLEKPGIYELSAGVLKAASSN